MTIPEMIRDRAERWKDRPCMRLKREGSYRDVSWSAFHGQACLVSHGLQGRGFRPGDRAAVLSHTRYEWAVADTGILSCGGVSVPLYPSLSRQEVKALLARSGSRVVFVSDREQAEKALPLLDDLEQLELVVAFEPQALAGASDPRAVTLDALATGETAHAREGIAQALSAARPDDLATLIFTSGTTGEPKGVRLTHRNILSNIDACLDVFPIGLGDVSLAHLPLAHIFARTCDYYLMLQAGVTVAFAESIQTVAQNLAEVRPTVAVSVPRIFEKVYGGIQSKAMESPAPIRALTFWALRVARQTGEADVQGRSLPPVLALQRAVADRLVYAKIREKFGGRLRMFVSGGAPLAPELARFFAVIGIPICEGYGLTETSPVVAANTPAHTRIGTVGRPLPNVEIRLDQDGEILVRGPSVFPGYWEDEAATQQSFTEDGFFRTGDIGVIDDDGFLAITDRKKDLIVTAGGKNVAPQKVENILKLSKYIADAMLYGDRKKFVSALIVPDREWLGRYAQWKAIPAAPVSELVRHPQILDYYARLVEKLQDKAGLASYEKVKRFVLLDQEFSAEQGEVTPTLKVRRRRVTDHYRDRLEALYREDA